MTLTSLLAPGSVNCYINIATRGLHLPQHGVSLQGRPRLISDCLRYGPHLR
jgi:hypothetical protein